MATTRKQSTGRGDCRRFMLSNHRIIVWQNARRWARQFAAQHPAAPQPVELGWESLHAALDLASTEEAKAWLAAQANMKAAEKGAFISDMKDAVREDFWPRPEHSPDVHLRVHLRDSIGRIYELDQELGQWQNWHCKAKTMEDRSEAEEAMDLLQAEFYGLVSLARGLCLELRSPWENLASLICWPIKTAGQNLA